MAQWWAGERSPHTNVDRVSIPLRCYMLLNLLLVLVSLGCPVFLPPLKLTLLIPIQPGQRARMKPMQKGSGSDVTLSLDIVIYALHPSFMLARSVSTRNNVFVL